MKFTPYYLTVPENINVTKGMVETLGYNALHGYDVFNWKITWGNRKNAMGVANHRTKTIELSNFVFDKLVDKREMLDTVLHEVAHVLAGGKAGHNYVWQSWCIKIGAKPEACYKQSDLNIKQGDLKYSTVCNVHGVQSHYSRRPTSPRSCSKCCGYFNTKYLLKVVQNW